MTPRDLFQKWWEAYLAALAGVCSDPAIIEASRADDWARQVADHSVKTIQKRFDSIVLGRPEP